MSKSDDDDDDIEHEVYAESIHYMLHAPSLGHVGYHNRDDIHNTFQGSV
jgi:hypothetical protein